jgi:hypothetical protein
MYMYIIISDLRDIEIKAVLPNTPLDVYMKDNRLHINDKTTHSRVNSIHESLLLSAMLSIVQENLRREIENEGFIIVEPDSVEETESYQNALVEFWQQGEGQVHDIQPNLLVEFFPGLHPYLKPYLEQDLELSNPEMKGVKLGSNIEIVDN